MTTKTIPIVPFQQTAAAPNGSAYGHPKAHPDALLTGVGPGTPCGEYLRRYWQPVAQSNKVTSRPQTVRLLGEDLILFRDKSGRAGLLYPRCMHRGTSLYYGKVDEEGIRCCYHGWKFDVQGNCLEQPCEPQGGLHRDKVRQPWYPVQELYGLVFAYMGPPERQPVLPRYDVLENMEEGEFILADDMSYGVVQDYIADPNAPYHWLQHWENVMDPYHVYVLHSTFSTQQFAAGFAVMPTVDFETIENGVLYHAYRSLPDGREMVRTNAAFLPNVSTLPNIELAHGRGNIVGWHVAVDDTHFRWFFSTRTTNHARFTTPRKLHNGKSWNELTEEERQDYPGDYEAQLSQGAVTLHSEEHLATSDRGVVMQRRLMKKQIEIVAAGGDPAGVHFDFEQALVKSPAGNYYKSAVAASTV